VRGPSDPAQKRVLRDASASVPNKMAQELALLKQPSPRSRFGTPAPPHPKAWTQNEEGPFDYSTGLLMYVHYLSYEFGAGLSFLTSRSPALGVAGPAPRILPLWRGLFEWRGGLGPRSEFPSHLDSGWWARDPGELASEQGRRGRAQARMVLGPFAETKGPRLQGRNPASNKWNYSEG